MRESLDIPDESYEFTVTALQSNLRALGEVSRDTIIDTAAEWPEPAAVLPTVRRLLASVEAMLLVSSYDRAALGRLPMKLLDQLNQNVAYAVEVLKGLRGLHFFPRDPDAAQRRDALLQRAEKVDNSAVSVSGALALLQAGAPGGQLSRALEASTAAATAAAELSSAKVAFETLADQAKVTIAAAKKAAEDQWISGRAAAFSSAMALYRREAYRWASGAMALATLLLALATMSIFYGAGAPLPKESWTAAGNISHFAPRLFIGTVVSFLLLICVKNFRAARHNELLNAHRWRAMTTFGRFRSSSEGAVSDAVLLQAAEAVFSVQPSGFSDREAGAGNHVTEMIALLRGEKSKD